MPKPWLLDIENRAVRNFRIVYNELPDGRCVLYVTTLDGGLVESVEESSRSDAERVLRSRGYVLLPRYAAFDLDEATR